MLENKGVETRIISGHIVAFRFSDITETEFWLDLDAATTAQAIAIRFTMLNGGGRSPIIDEAYAHCKVHTHMLTRTWSCQKSPGEG